MAEPANPFIPRMDPLKWRPDIDKLHAAIGKQAIKQTGQKDGDRNSR